MHLFEAKKSLLSKSRITVITFRWIVCFVFSNEGNFTAVHFAVVRVVGILFENFFPDGKVSSLLSSKVLFNEPTVCTSKVGKGVGKV